MKIEIKIDENVKCKQCGKGGAVNGNICMECVNKNLKKGKYDKIIKSNQPKERMI